MAMIRSDSIPDEILKRKGARNTRSVPPEVRRLLDEGHLETVNLSEWLVVDQLFLAGRVFPELQCAELLEETRSALRAIESPTTLKRMKSIGRLLAGSRSGRREFDAARVQLQTHPSDIVRGWAACMVGAREDLDVTAKLKRLRSLAADRNMSVREVAWLAVRDEIAGALDAAIPVLAGWALDQEPTVRRFASEVTRPRGVWCRHIDLLKREPHRALPILEPLRADTAVYVRNSVGNWLNDASKSQPAWVNSLAARWRKESDCPETRFILRRGLRTLARKS